MSAGATNSVRLKNIGAKLDAIRNGKYTPDQFLIADAKDGDMAFGMPAPGPSKKIEQLESWANRDEYLDNMRQIAKSGLIDILLTSVSTAETLVSDGLFTETAVTPAVRLNDTSDIWSARGSSYREHPSQAFATADLAIASDLVDLGLYSVTFYNQLDNDLKTLQSYKYFREQIRNLPISHFLEVFNPAFDIGLKDTDLGDYINDMILKTLAGVSSIDQPLFLKMQFNGARAMQELANYAPDKLVVGILGGAAGTTRDTFELASQAEQAGARVALFGRKINLSESPLELVRLMRLVIERQESAETAVRHYHDHLKENGMIAQRELKSDLQITDPALMRD